MTAAIGSADAPMREIQQVLAAQLEAAAARLMDRAATDRSVHEVRRELKRARATLRLLRPCLGKRRYHRENAIVRDAARPLSAVRDAKVLLQVLRELAPEARDSRSAPTARGAGSSFLTLLRSALRRERRDARRELGRRELRAAASALRALRRRLGNLSAAEYRRGSVGAGIERAYRGARKAYALAHHRATDERLHEWRKRTKYLLNQLLILGAPDRRKMAKRCKQYERLAQQLGDDHDLAVLNGKLVKYATGSESAAEELMSRLSMRRQTLQRNALALGRRAYAEPPARARAKFVRRLKGVRSA